MQFALLWRYVEAQALVEHKELANLADARKKATVKPKIDDL
jgi:hypothetical protein